MKWLARGETALPADLDWLSTAERNRAADLRFTKRRMDYLISRWTAKQAIATVLDLGGEVQLWSRIEVRNRSTGAPVAFVDGQPLGAEISLTDRAGWAVCLVGPDGRRVGCDLELVEPRTPGFVRDYLTDSEQRLVADDPDPQSGLMPNLLWSAKESALKVLGTGLRRDTRSVEVSLDELAGRHGWFSLTVRTPEGLVIPGWWRRFGRFLLTVAADRPTDSPVTLEDPPALLDALPTHSWLDRPV